MQLPPLVSRQKRADMAAPIPTRKLPSSLLPGSLWNSSCIQSRSLDGTSINYRIHTDAIKENLIPPELSAKQISLVYANEADVLNMALFGMTAKQQRDSHPELKGNIRDYINVSQLVCLSNLENLNAVFINDGMPQSERLAKLNAVVISKTRVLTEDHRVLSFEPSKGQDESTFTESNQFLSNTLF